MSAGVWLGVALLGGVGCVARVVLAQSITARFGSGFPWGTLAVNLSGAFVLGVLVGAAVHGDAYRLFGTGLLGAYTTFSGWAFESRRLAERGDARLGAANFAVSLLLGVALAWAGREVGGLV